MTLVTRFITLGLIMSGSACAGQATRAPNDPRNFSVEKPAMAYPGNPQPRYPEELLATRDSGTVRLRFAVEKAGVVDMRSVTVVSSPHPAFTREVLRVLEEYRFLPAEVGESVDIVCRSITDSTRRCGPRVAGTKLRTEVEMAFVFVAPPTAT